MNVAAKLAAKIDHEPDRLVLPSRGRDARCRRSFGTRRASLRRDRRCAGQLGVHQQGHAGLGQLRHHRAEVGLVALGNSSIPEWQRNALKPSTPAAIKRPDLAGNAGYDAAVEAAVDRELISAASSFDAPGPRRSSSLGSC